MTLASLIVLYFPFSATVPSTASPHLVFKVPARAAGRVRNCQIRSVATCCARCHGQMLLDLWGSPCSTLRSEF